MRQCLPRQAFSATPPDHSLTGSVVLGLGLILPLQPLAAPIHIIAAEAIEIGAVEHPGQDEEQVGQAIQVLAWRGVDGLGGGEGHHGAL